MSSSTISRFFFSLGAAIFCCTSAQAQESSTLSSPADFVLQGFSGDEGPNPLEQKRRRLRQMAVQSQLTKKGRNHPVVEVARGQYVELGRQGEDSIWTVLAEFGDKDSYQEELKSGIPGPLHNQIPQPDRITDNATIWHADFSRAYYEDILFSENAGANSMRNYYIEQSSNRYTVNGDVTEWVKVPYNAAHYGRDFCGQIVCFHTWLFIQDSVNAWYQAQLDAGKSPEEIDAYLSRYDVWDRYDFDGDGNFNEPDGYIDHFQSVHAGEGQEAGGGSLGDDAIWSHRWYILFDIWLDGPTLEDGTQVPFGGIRIGNSKYWIGDYTIEPENGGVGVFAHEFAHDLGLPDLYDTDGNTGGGENSTGFWTLMSSGSWLSDGHEDIGSAPGHMGAWEKLTLGWLNYEVASTGSISTHRLGPAETNTKQAQGLIVVLPDKEVIVDIAAPYAGNYFYYSDSGNNLDHYMYKPVTLSPNSSLSAMVNFDIELDWDYAYLVVSTDGGTTWASVPTNQSTDHNPNNQNFGNGITGNSSGWTTLSADLSGFDGDVLLGFRYWTDAFVVYPGFMIDEISINGDTADGAEDETGWTLNGFKISTGIETKHFFNAYVAEYRTYRGYDKGLKNGPYNFGFLDKPFLEKYVERFSYQDGLLVSYWDSSFTDNNTGFNCASGRCGGLILPVDAHPQTMYRADGGVWRNRVQSYDSTFGLSPTDALTLNWNSQPSFHPSLEAVSVFDDNNTYFNQLENPGGSAYHPHTNTQIEVRSISTLGNFMQVLVNTPNRDQ